MNQPTAPPRVKLGPESVWELISRRDMGQNELARAKTVLSTRVPGRASRQQAC